MGTDVRVALSAFSHPKLLRLRSMLGTDGVLALVQLWAFAGEHKHNGVLENMSAEYIETASMYGGEKGTLAKALLEIGLLDGSLPNCSLHDWKKHQHFAAGHEQRCRIARAAIEKRWKKRETKALGVQNPSPKKLFEDGYSKRLKDPRWQKRRLQILEKANWMCQKCNKTTDTLNVHHKAYIRNRAPWEYDDDMLVVLCETCHGNLHEGQK